MQDTGSLTSITSPEQAIREYVAGQFIVWLGEEVASRVKSWPVMGQMEALVSDPQKMRKFLLQVYLSERAMWDGADGEPGFLRFATGNLSESDEPSAEYAMDKLQASVSSGDLPAAWSKLFQSLDMPAEDLKRVEPKEITRTYIAEFSEVFSTADWQVAVGAFVTMMLVMPYKYAAILNLAQKTGLKDTEVLKSLGNREQQSRQLAYELLEKISFSESSKAEIWDGATKALSIEEEFFGQAFHYLENHE